MSNRCKCILWLFLFYVISMAIFPLVIYLLFKDSISVSDEPWPFYSAFYYSGNIKIIMYCIFLVFDIIFSFVMFKYILNDSIYKVIALVSIFFSFLLKTISFISIVSFFGNIIETFGLYDYNFVIIDHYTLSALLCGKTEVGYWSYGIYIGFFFNWLLGKNKKKLILL